MINKLLGILMISTLTMAFFAVSDATAKKIPLRDFFKNPEKSGYQISPDGKHYSYLAPFEKRMNIFIQEIGKKNAVRLTQEKDRDISGYFWKNNNRILFLKDNGGDENFKLYGVDIDGKNLKCLTDFEKVRTQILDPLIDYPKEMIIGLNKRNSQIFDAYRINIETGEMKMIAENPGNIQGWQTDHEGKLRVATTTDGVNTSILYRDTEEDSFRTVLTTNFKESFNPEFFTFDNKNLYGTSNIGRDKSVAVEFDPKTGKEIKVLFENADYDLNGLSYSRKRKVLTYTSWTAEKTQINFFDDASQKVYNRLKKELGKYEIAVTSVTLNEDKYIIRTYSDRSLGSFYIYDLKTDKLDKITDVSTWLKEDELCEQKPVEYQSRDGLTIHGYLTLPKGKETKNLPVVVNPHGGPWACSGSIRCKYSSSNLSRRSSSPFFPYSTGFPLISLAFDAVSKAAKMDPGFAFVEIRLGAAWVPFWIFACMS